MRLPRASWRPVRACSPTRRPTRGTQREHPTSNTQHPRVATAGSSWMLNVGCFQRARGLSSLLPETFDDKKGVAPNRLQTGLRSSARPTSSHFCPPRAGAHAPAFKVPVMPRPKGQNSAAQFSRGKLGRVSASRKRGEMLNGLEGKPAMAKPVSKLSPVPLSGTQGPPPAEDQTRLYAKRRCAARTPALCRPARRAISPSRSRRRITSPT